MKGKLMKTIPNRIYEILNTSVDSLQIILSIAQNNAIPELTKVEHHIDRIGNGFENIETLIQAIAILDAQSKELT